MVVDYAELRKVVELSKIVYSNNFTVESNYLFFHESGRMWTSNAQNSIATEDVLLIHTFKTPLFKNIGILTKELHDVLSAVSDEMTIEQMEDHIVITDKGNRIEIKTVHYETCPLRAALDRDWVEAVPAVESILKPLVEFMDKNEQDAKNIHFDGEAVYTTDVSSIHKGVVLDTGHTFAIAPRIVALFPEFKYIQIEKYLYLKSEAGTILVTSVDDIMDISFLEDERSLVYGPYTFPDMKGASLLKVFNADTKKPDRTIMIIIKDGEMRAVASDDRKGSASVLLSEGLNTTEDLTFVVNSDKFISCAKQFTNFTVEDNSLLIASGDVSGDETGNCKYICIEGVI